MPNHWLTRCDHFPDISGYQSKQYNPLKTLLISAFSAKNFKVSSVTPNLYKHDQHVMIQLLAKLKNFINKGVQSHLKFSKF